MKSLVAAAILAAIVAGAFATIELTTRIENIESKAVTKSEIETGAATRLSTLENELERLKLAALDKKLIGEKVVTLPQDQGAWHLSLWFANKSTDQASARLASFFATDEILRQVATQAIVHEHDASRPDPIYSARYVAEALPGVMLQNSRGVVLYKATGSNIPPTGAQLAAEILESIGVKAQDCPDGNCPVPDSRTVRPIFPDRRPSRVNSANQTSGQTFTIAAVVIALAALLAYVVSQNQQRTA